MVAPAVKPVTPPVLKKKAEQVVRDWAATLVPQNAPDPKHCGPMSWIRHHKIEELISALKLEGHL